MHLYYAGKVFVYLASYYHYYYYRCIRNFKQLCKFNQCLKCLHTAAVMTLSIISLSRSLLTLIRQHFSFTNHALDFDFLRILIHYGMV